MSWVFIFVSASNPYLFRFFQFLPFLQTKPGLVSSAFSTFFCIFPRFSTFSTFFHVFPRFSTFSAFFYVFPRFSTFFCVFQRFSSTFFHVFLRFSTIFHVFLRFSRIFGGNFSVEQRPEIFHFSMFSRNRSNGCWLLNCIIFKLRYI